MTASEAYKEIYRRLLVSLTTSEAEASARILMEDIAGFSRKKLFMYGDREILPSTEEILFKAVSRILDEGEPVQYVVGLARFCGLDFIVSSAVLIPRPETQWLVDTIVEKFRNQKELRGYDFCTGSGCIAIALARALPFSSMDASDISQEALEIACKNAERLKTPNVNFKKEDVLAFGNTLVPEEAYDFIVSNPPYVLPSELSKMDNRVLKFEPKEALFVPEDNPIVFYKSISEFAIKALKPEGMLLFEINPLTAEDVKKDLEAKGFTDIEIRKDYQGFDRYVVARKDS